LVLSLFVVRGEEVSLKKIFHIHIHYTIIDIKGKRKKDLKTDKSIFLCEYLAKVLRIPS